MKFNYQARTKEGEIRIGQVEAFSKEAAVALLQKHGLYPTFVEEVSLPFYAREIALFKKISAKDIVIASRELAIMFRSGVPFIDALSTIAKETKNPKLKEIFLDLAREVEGGTTLSAALSRYPETFSPFYISMVKSGEISGELPKALDVLAENIERNYHFNSRIRGALFYPILVIIASLVVFFLVLFVIVPKLSEFTAGLGVEPPIFVQVLLGIGRFLKEWGVILIIFLIGIISALIVYFKTPEGKEAIARFSLKLPLIGSFLKMINLCRFGENLSTLISGGIPIGQALEISSEVVNSSLYKEIIFMAKDAVRSGDQISSVLKNYPELFPPFFNQIVTVGEKSGALAKSLLNIANFYEKEVERTINNFSTILEPALIIFLGGVVGLLLFTVLNTIYKTILSTDIYSLNYLPKLSQMIPLLKWGG